MIKANVVLVSLYFLIFNCFCGLHFIWLKPFCFCRAKAIRSLDESVLLDYPTDLSQSTRSLGLQNGLFEWIGFFMFIDRASILFGWFRRDYFF